MREMQTGVHPDPTLAEVQGPAAVLWDQAAGKGPPAGCCGTGKGLSPSAEQLGTACHSYTLQHPLVHWPHMENVSHGK